MTSNEIAGILMGTSVTSRTLSANYHIEDASRTRPAHRGYMIFLFEETAPAQARGGERP